MTLRAVILLYLEARKSWTVVPPPPEPPLEMAQPESQDEREERWQNAEDENLYSYWHGDRGHAVCDHCGTCLSCKHPHELFCQHHPREIYRAERQKAEERGNHHLLSKRKDRYDPVKGRIVQHTQMTSAQLAEAKRLFEEQEARLSAARRGGRPRKKPSTE